MACAPAGPDELIHVSGVSAGSYKPGRWRRFGGPIPVSAAIAAAAKKEQERQKRAREKAIKEGRSAEFLWGASKVKESGVGVLVTENS